MFTGLSAFPLTPLLEDRVDEGAYRAIIERLADAGVDSITALGSTGSYAYLDRHERRQVAGLAVQLAGDVPVIVGIGALRTSHVRALAEDAQEAGAAAVLLAPLTYQAHTADDVYGLYQDVVAGLSVPMVVYDNPGTTHFTFTDELYAAIAALPQVVSVKIPGVPTDPSAARERVQTIKARIPDNTTVGVSGDVVAAIGLTAGCDVWYSVIAGTLPGPALTITRAVQAGDVAAADAESVRLLPLWALFAEYGSLRVTAAIAEQLGYATASCLPRPILGLDATARARVAAVIDRLELAN